MILNSRLGDQARLLLPRIATAALLTAVLIGCCASAAEVQAQWTTNGNNINNTNSGNVGIGTTGPSKKLVVQSDTANDHLSIVRPSTNAAVLNIGIDNTGPFIESTTVNRPISFYTHNGTSVAERVRIDKDGKLGVGTPNPSSAVHITKSFAPSYGQLVLQDPNANDASLTSYMSFYGSTSRRGVFGFGRFAGASDPELYLANEQTSGGFRFRNSSSDLVTIQNGGNVGIGTTTPGAKLAVNGNTNVIGNVTVTGTGNITATGTIEGGNIKAKYQDVAEWVPSTWALPAGTVVTLDPTKSNHVEASSKAYDTRVAGVISAQPGIALGEQGKNKVLVATTGRVRIKVDASHGPIQVGDLLVTSGVPGLDMKSKPIDVGGVEVHRPGTLIGKALEPLAKGTGEILVLLSLQ
jgi:hypothetical protein